MSNRLSITGLGDPVRTKGRDQLYFNCPFHDDTKGHLGVNLKKGVYNCFKCGVKGRTKDLESPLSAFKDKVEAFLFGEKQKEVLKEILELPKEYQLITPQSGLPYRYLKSRKLWDSEIKKYRIGYCGEGFYQDRIIIPMYEENKLTYFVGRAYTTRTPKYLNALMNKRGTIFRTFDKRAEKAIVCEGVFDALRIGQLFPAISILGKVLNGTEQCQSIVKATKKAYIVLDQDAEKDGFIAANILNYYIPTSVMFIKQKDPGSMTLKQIEEILPK